MDQSNGDFGYKELGKKGGQAWLLRLLQVITKQEGINSINSLSHTKYTTLASETGSSKSLVILQSSLFLFLSYSIIYNIPHPKPYGNENENFGFIPFLSSMTGV